MKLNSARLLAITPLITAMATSALAQEAATPTPATRVEQINVAVETSSVVIPMKITVGADGTFVFTTPADNSLTLSLDGDVIMTVPAGGEATAAPFRVITSLTAGDHLLEVEGAELQLEQVAMISFYEIGAEPVSVASVAEALTAEQAKALAALTGNGSTGAADEATTQLASATAPARQPFLIGGGSANKSSPAPPADASASAAVSAQPSTSGSATATTENVMTPTQVAASGGSTGGGGVFRRTVQGAIDTVTGGNGGGTPVAGGGGTPTTPGIPPTGTPVPPPVIPADMALVSELTPPTNPTLTQAVQIVGGATDAGIVATTGQTLFGAVMDPATFDIVNVSIAPSNRTMTVDVGSNTGQFALRLFPEDLIVGEATVTVTGASSVDPNVTSVPVAYTFQGGVPGDGITQALSRLTNGPTPDLYARVRAMGFPAYVEEQLNPGAINDSAFNAMGFDGMINRAVNTDSNVLRQLFRYNIAHAAFSERQLQDVMGDFWNNHFHAATKGTGVVAQNVYDREFFRENAFGRFEDMLLYSARSPLMSQFLDNDDNRVGNINENYGREIMELHTVGVNGGYGDDDVIAVSRVFTGWDFRRTNPDEEEAAQEYAFEFRPDRHDTDDKVIPFLNTTIAGLQGDAGVQEGEQLIAILAADPRTHSYVCGKIVQRFVADDPPANFVQICTAAWAANDGNMGEVMRAILTAPEYATNVTLQRNKAKTPYEFAVSVIRALDLTPDTDDDNGDFFRRFREASVDGGYDPHNFLVPTGMAEVGAAWTNSASMIGKLKQVTEAVERPENYNLDMMGQISDAGLETAEEVAGYILTVATADRYTLEEYEAMIEVLKGVDGIFDPLNPDQDETDAFERAAGLLVVLPSFQLQ